jgi:5-methylcytosine-specific restriction protein A
MPIKPRRPCAYPGCPELVRGGRYCPAHQQEVARKQDAARGSSAQRGYGYRWQKLRIAYLRVHPICVDPFGVHKRDGRIEPATDVDHIIPRAQGGTDDEDNLEAMCHSCHSRKTDEQDHGFIGYGGQNLYTPQTLDRSGSEVSTPAKLGRGG